MQVVNTKIEYTYAAREIGEHIHLTMKNTGEYAITCGNFRVRWGGNADIEECSGIVMLADGGDVREVGRMDPHKRPTSCGNANEQKEIIEIFANIIACALDEKNHASNSDNKHE